MADRFVFDPSIRHFKDTLTGKDYSEYNLDEVVDLLNQINKRADENAEMIQTDKFDLILQLRQCHDYVEKAQVELEQIYRIMNKYEIDSYDKLDLILLHQGVW